MLEGIDADDDEALDADDMDDADDWTDEAADEALVETDEAADDAAEEAEPVDDWTRLVDDGVDCPFVADPDDARPLDPCAFKHPLAPWLIVTGAVAAVAPVESVMVRVIEVPAGMLTVQVY